MANASRRDVLKLSAVGAALAASGATAARPGPEGRREKRLADTFDVAFAGGGIKGAAFAGAVEAFLAAGYKFRRLIGTSAGAIVATCLAAGYDAKGLRGLLTDRIGTRLRFSTFLAPREYLPPPEGVEPKKWAKFQLGLAGGMFALPDTDKFPKGQVKNYVHSVIALLSTGATADDGPFIEWMEKRLANSHYRLPGNVRLKDFHERTREGRMDLSLVATDLTAQRTLVLNHLTAPDVPVVQAVRMSMGIPLVWREVEWKGEWGTYRPAAKWPQAEGGRIEGHRVVDGGVLSNFPLKFLLSERHRSSEGVLGPLPGGREAQVLGLLLDEGKKGEGDAAERKKRFADRLPVYQSVSRLIDTMTSAWDKDAIEEYKAEPYVCHIGVKGVDTLDFNMSEGQVAALVKSGSSAMKEYLDNWKPAT